jgi:hypothetical protein
VSAPQPIEARTDHELLELICEVEWSRMLHERVVKEDVLEALSARAELIERLVRWRWLVVEQVRAAGASWAEVDDAARVASGEAKADYERVLARQRRFGLVGADRADPGPREP